MYQFGGQNIHRIIDDISGAAVNEQNELILAKRNHMIEIISLESPREPTIDSYQKRKPRRDFQAAAENDIQSKLTFPTVDEVVEMVYCRSRKRCR